MVQFLLFEVGMVQETHNSSKKALGHLRVIEIGEEIGEFCCKTFADMGADVIRIEPPGGAQTRDIGPFYKNERNPERSLHFWSYNLNKRSITIDLESNEGQLLLKKLVKESDILVESTPANWMQERNLDYTTLSKVNPKLIFVSISPFGRVGPHSQMHGGELVAWASSGYMYTTGWKWQKPTHPWGRQASHAAGLFAVTGAMAAIFERRRTGLGKQIDVSMQKSVASTVEQNVPFYIGDGVVSGRRENDHVNGFGGSKLIECKDGWVHMNIGWRNGHNEIVEWMKEEGMAEDLIDEKWHDSKFHRQNFPHVLETITKWAKLKTKAEFFHQGQERGLECGPVNSVAEALNDPQMQSREFWVEVEHPEISDGEKFTYPGAPCILSETPWAARRRAPLIGEDNENVFQDLLGLSSKDQDELKKKNII
tara:strand:- start:6420 stop:7691 length:1272 start_codon:yes stop_codon:yes gene_type:complete